MEAIKPMTPNSQPQPRLAELVVRAVGTLREAKSPSFFRLRRAARPLDAMLEPVFPRLRAELSLHGLWQPPDELLACALLALARVRARPDAKPLGEALRSQARPYSDLRFRTLVTAEGAEELLTQVLRAMQYCNYNVNPFNLADVILGWTENRVDETRKKLVMHFHGIRSGQPAKRRAAKR
jgi:CRISPR type I-E-associated protein CasB/Cse2